MSKFFDIRPPRPRQTNTHKKNKSQTTSKSRKSSSGFLIVVIIICIFIFLFSLKSNTASTYQQSDSSNPNEPIDNLITEENSPKPSSNPFITPSKTDSNAQTSSENSEQESDNSQVGNDIQISVLNGARSSGVASEVKNILENNNIPVFNIGDTDNSYNSTFIYYTEKNTQLAQKIQETLSNYEPIMEIDQNLANDNKITIVVGANQ